MNIFFVKEENQFDTYEGYVCIDEDGYSYHVGVTVDEAINNASLNNEFATICRL